MHAITYRTFKPAEPAIWLDRHIASAILRGEESVRTGWGSLYRVEEIQGRLYLVNGYPVHLDELELIARDRRVFIGYPDRSVEPVESRESGYVSLVYTGPNKHYTLEKDGIHMHRVSGTDPWRDTLSKISAARVKPGHRVYDTCMGLGYTAIAALLRGAEHVLTVELDERVIMVAEENPYSRALASPAVKVVHGDTVEVAGSLPDESYDVIIHDPPRFTAATGDLYSTSLYMEFYRILRPGGRLFHYTGAPMRRSSRNLPGEVSSRLKRVGFKVFRAREALGVVGVKPRY